MSSIKGYKDPKARQAYINKWTKEHYEPVKGYRPTCHFAALHRDLTSWVELSPKNFLFGRLKEPLNIYGDPTIRVHVPRSLLKRARIQVDKITREIKGTSAMHTANK